MATSASVAGSHSDTSTSPHVRDEAPSTRTTYKVRRRSQWAAGALTGMSGVRRPGPRSEAIGHVDLVAGGDHSATDRSRYTASGQYGEWGTTSRRNRPKGNGRSSWFRLVRPFAVAPAPGK